MPSRHSPVSTTEGQRRCAGLLCACSCMRRPLWAPDPSRLQVHTSRNTAPPAGQTTRLCILRAQSPMGTCTLWPGQACNSLELGAPPIPEGLSPIGPPFTTLCSPSDPSKKERRSLGWRERPASQSCLSLYLSPVGARGIGVLSLLHPLPDSGLGVAASWWPRGPGPEGLPVPLRG